MPRGKPTNGRTSRSQDVPFGGFIDLRLTAEEKEQFGEWRKTWSIEDVDDLLSDDLRLGASWDETNQTFLATLTSDRHTGGPLRCILTARANAFHDAVALVAFKHIVLLEGEWGRFKPSTGRASEI